MLGIGKPVRVSFVEYFGPFFYEIVGDTVIAVIFVLKLSGGNSFSLKSPRVKTFSIHVKVETNLGPYLYHSLDFR